MRILKQLVSAIDSGMHAEQESAMSAAREWLNRSKSFEYTGLVKIKFQGDLTLEHISQDLSDVVKLMTGASNNTSVDVELYLILPEKPSVVVVPALSAPVEPPPVIIAPAAALNHSH